MRIAAHGVIILFNLFCFAVRQLHVIFDGVVSTDHFVCFRVASLCLLLGLPLLVSTVLRNSLVKEFLAEGLDFLLLLFADLRWIFHAIVFEVGVDELLGDLMEGKEAQISTCPRSGIMNGSMSRLTSLA